MTTLVFCGCNFPNCPRTSIYEASERDFRVVLARDAVSGLYERGEIELAGIGVHVIDSAELVERLSVSEGAGEVLLEPGLAAGFDGVELNAIARQPRARPSRR